MDELVESRVALRFVLEQVSRDVPDWGLLPDPQELMDRLEAFIDAKIQDALGNP